MDDERLLNDTASIDEVIDEVQTLLREPPASPAGPEPAPQAAPRPDRTATVLLAVACGLCLGLIGVLGYWLSILG